jgi:hypothetical protein
VGFVEMDDFDKIAVIISQDQEFYKNLVMQGKIDDAFAIIDLMAYFVVLQESMGRE